MELKVRVEAHALLNAVRYGRAITGKVIPKILGEFPEAKQKMKETMPLVDEIVKKVNLMGDSERISRLQKIAPDLLEKPEKKKRELPELEHAIQGKVVTRLPPEPSKYNHLGHALTFIINAIYARRYEGKLVLRFEDANPDKVNQEFVDEMLKDITEYLGIQPDETRFVSDDMEQLIQYAEQLVKQGDAFMCFCTRESISENRRLHKECACRNSSKENNMEEWHNFVNGKYMNGEATLRFKGDMNSKNSVLLDPVLWRAVNTPHFKKGGAYKIWPLYDFYSGIEEHLCGVTHVIRSNEFDLRVELQNLIQEKLSLTKPKNFHYGRFNITGATTKGREIREGIEKGEFIGWDDPRLVTLRALKRRGIRRDAYWKLVEELGLSPYPVKLDFSMLAAKNREIIDPIAHRYSFIEEPIRLHISGVEKHLVTQHLHPDKKDGGRQLISEGEYWIRASDAKMFKESGKIRLKDDLTFEQRDGKHIFLSREPGAKFIINWLPAENNLPCKIRMPDGTLKEGLGEKGIQDLKVDDIVQFERFGFCRLDRVTKEGVFEFWFTHD